jgi:hypothetical protein
MSTVTKATAAPRRKVPASPYTKSLLAAAKLMGRMVREENRRWGLPLIVMKDGRIQNVKA